MVDKNHNKRGMKMKKAFGLSVLVFSLLFFISATAWSAEAVTIGPGALPSWHGDAQVQLGWVFADPTSPQDSSPIPSWDKAVGAIPVWSYDASRTAWGLPAQWYIKIANVDNDNPVKHMWISWVYDFDQLAWSPYRIATNVDWFPFTDWTDLGNIDEWFDSAGLPTTNYLAAAYGRFTWQLDLKPNPEYEEVWLGLYSAGYYAREVYIETICVEGCEGNFDDDGDVDGSDLAVFAADFGRTDCDTGATCEGDFDGDNDVDGSDLAKFAADFGRTDCP
jgi:hypothetical protein